MVTDKIRRHSKANQARSKLSVTRYFILYLYNWRKLIIFIYLTDNVRRTTHYGTQFG
jgi:hypothetical protein